MRNFLQRLDLVALLVLAMLGWGTPLHVAVAQGTEKVVEVDMPAQPLEVALRSLADKLGVQVLFNPNDVKGVTAPALKGRLTVSQILERITEGTGLSAVFDGSNAIAVRKKSDAGRKTAEAASAMAVVGGSERIDQERPVRAEAIQVTGSRLSRPEDQGAVPVTAITRSQIDQLGASNLAQVLDYLPQQSYSFAEPLNSFGSRTVQLRGLPAGTIVLINGRRTVPSAALGSSNAFDLNTIPLAAVERIEILSTSSSAVYGADAVGGVVNVILKTSIEHPVVDLYAGDAKGGGDERRLSFSGGRSFDRGRYTVILDVFERDALFGVDREIAANQDYRRFGGPDVRSNASNPGTIHSRSTGNLPGLNSPVAAVPSGSTGVGLRPSDFSATAGQQNRGNLGAFRSFLPDSERYSGFLSGEIDVFPTTTTYAELLHSHRKETVFFAPGTLVNRLVPAANPFNPFGVDVGVDFLLTGVPPRQQLTKTDFWRGVAGIRGRSGSWDWDFSLLETKEKAESTFFNTVNTTRVNAALASTNPATALNPFQDGPGGSPELLASLVSPPVIDRNTSDQLQASGLLRGSPFSLPAGPVNVVVGGESRKEKMHFELNAGGLVVGADRRVDAVFAEARLPVFGSKGRGLNLEIAARHDRYNDFGGTTNPQAGFVWELSPDLAFRSAYAKSFRAPTLFDLHQPLASFPVVVTDPRRNSENASVTLFAGGNPDLQPEKAKSTSVGFIYKPIELPSTRLAATYWKISYTDRISAVNPLLDEGRFANLVVRAAPTPADVAAGLPGQLVQVYQLPANFAETETSGVDLEAIMSWRMLGGRIVPALYASWTYGYRAADLPNSPATDRVGLGNTAGTIPKWRATASLTFEKSPVSATLVARYVSSYQDVTVFNVPLNRTISSQTYWDAQLAAALDTLSRDSKIMKGMIVRAGVINLFDRSPRFATFSTSVGFDISQSDPRQRFVYVSLSKTF